MPMKVLCFLNKLMMEDMLRLVEDLLEEFRICIF